MLQAQYFKNKSWSTSSFLFQKQCQHLRQFFLWSKPTTTRSVTLSNYFFIHFDESFKVLNTLYWYTNILRFGHKTVFAVALYFHVFLSDFIHPMRGSLSSSIHLKSYYKKSNCFTVNNFLLSLLIWICYSKNVQIECMLHQFKSAILEMRAREKCSSYIQSM